MTDFNITLKNVRLSFPKLVAPEAFKGKGGETSEPRFSAAFLIPKDDAATAQVIKSVMANCAKDKWPKDWQDELKRLSAGNRICLVDGDTQTYDGYEGMYALRTSSQATRPPTLVNEYAVEMKRDDPATLAKFYAGCMVNAIVRFWAQGAESGYGKRINANLLAVQFAGDAPAFGAGKVSADAFEPVEGVPEAMEAALSKNDADWM